MRAVQGLTIVQDSAKTRSMIDTATINGKNVQDAIRLMLDYNLKIEIDYFL